jgi:hypothetical protein
VVAEEAVPAASNGGGMVDPSSVRPRLAEAAAESLEDIRRVLLETATGANRQLWATISCKHCGRAGRYEITVPDNKVRLDAIQALLHESLGRPGQAEAQPVPALPATVEQARALSWDQLSLVFATQFAEEIGSVLDRGDGLPPRAARLAQPCRAPRLARGASRTRARLTKTRSQRCGRSCCLGVGLQHLCADDADGAPTLHSGSKWSSPGLRRAVPQIVVCESPS